jgi:hypothetical protein
MFPTVDIRADVRFRESRAIPDEVLFAQEATARGEQLFAASEE